MYIYIYTYVCDTYVLSSTEICNITIVNTYLLIIIAYIINLYNSINSH